MYMLLSSFSTPCLIINTRVCFGSLFFYILIVYILKEKKNVYILKLTLQEIRIFGPWKNYSSSKISKNKINGGNLSLPTLTIDFNMVHLYYFHSYNLSRDACCIWKEKKKKFPESIRISLYACIGIAVGGMKNQRDI